MSGGLTLTNVSLSLTRLRQAVGAFVPPVVPKIFRRFWSDGDVSGQRFWSKEQHNSQNFYSQVRIEV